MYKKFLFLIPFVLVVSLACNSYANDTTQLKPLRMYWVLPPQETSPYTIDMNCCTALDPNYGGVVYDFNCINIPSASSGWISSPHYEANGLTPNTTYTFNVQAQDARGNTNIATFNLSATTENNSTPPVMRLDFNNSSDNNDPNTQPGYLAFIMEDSGADINGIIVDINATNMSSERRSDPCGTEEHYETGGIGDCNTCYDPCLYDPRWAEALYRDAIYGFGSPPSPITITLWGIGVGQDCNITLWAYDNQVNDSNRIADWTANGVPIFVTNFIGGTQNDPPVINYAFQPHPENFYKWAWSGRATADAFGRIILTCTQDGNSPASEPFAYVDGLKVEPNAAVTFVPTKYAHRPIPISGATCVTVNSVLNWNTGAGVALQDLYLGTNFNAVSNATRTSNNNLVAVKLDQPAGTTSWDPCGSTTYLKLDTTYYWRIDENDGGSPPSVYTGQVCSFTTCPNSIVDNFEEYVPPCPYCARLEAVWQDYYTQPAPVTNSQLFNCSSPVHIRGTLNSMEYQFMNNSWGSPYYSEARANIANTAQGQGCANGLGIDPNWSGMGAQSLVLYFYGTPGNDANFPMYVTLTDSSNDSCQVNYYGAWTDIDVPSWHEWNIGLNQFTGVNMSNVKQMTIGFGIPGEQAATDGTVYFDDIQLYTTRCALPMRDANFALIDFAPAGSPYNGDCKIDYQELEVMAAVWLNTDQLLTTQNPGDANLVVYYPLNEGVGCTNADDCNEVFSYPSLENPDVCDPKWGGLLWNLAATPPGYYDTNWVSPGYNGTGSALSFDGSQGARVECGEAFGNLGLGIGSGKVYSTDINAITVSAWVYWLGNRTWDAYLSSKPQGIVGKRDGWDDADMVWMLELDTNGMNRSIGFRHYAVGDTVTPDVFAPNNTMIPFIGQWVHVAAAFPYPSGNPADANSHARVYVNGGQVADGPWRFSLGDDVNIFLSIGNTQDNNAWPNGPESFYGYIDDVRIYNRALDANEIAYLANPDTSITQLWIPLTTPANVTDVNEIPPYTGLQPKGKRSVNFRDFAMVIKYWLTEEMFPRSDGASGI